MEEKIIAVASHTFSPTEQNWSTAEHEAYAIKWPIPKPPLHQPQVLKPPLHQPQLIWTSVSSTMPIFDSGWRFHAISLSWNSSNVNQTYGLTWSVEAMVKRKRKCCLTLTPAGKAFKIQSSGLYTYVPLWCLGEINGLQIIPEMHTPQTTQYHKHITDAFFAYHSTSTIPREKISDHINNITEQSTDDALLRIMRTLQTNDFMRNFILILITTRFPFSWNISTNSV